MAGEKDSRRIRRLLRECDSEFVKWDVPVPFDISALVEHLSRRRDRLIHLVPMAMGGDRPSGIWLALAAMDVVVYEADTSRTHQEHIIAHELAHIVFGYASSSPVDDSALSLLFPDLDPGLVRDMLNRAEYCDAHELEAEVMASVILRRMNPRQAETGTHEDMLTRLERFFS